MRALAMAAMLAVIAASVGCGRPIAGRPARGFVEIKDDPAYDFRAVAPEGVALAARAVRITGPDDVGFWERAVALRMREIDGYALLQARDVQTAEGSTGRELTFGHDEDGKPYLYRVRLEVRRGRLLVIEAGGHRAEVERMESGIAWMIAQLELR